MQSNRLLDGGAGFFLLFDLSSSGTETAIYDMEQRTRANIEKRKKRIFVSHRISKARAYIYERIL